MLKLRKNENYSVIQFPFVFYNFYFAIKNLFRSLSASRILILTTAFDELLTACFVAPEKFSSRVVEVISNIQKKAGTEFRWKQLQDLIQDQQSTAIGAGVSRKR